MKSKEQIEEEIENYETLATQVGDVIQRRACRDKINVLYWVLK
jgi:hypothetical protein